MFGHNDQHHETTLPAPAPDGDLADDQGVTTAPPVDDTTAGEFLDDVSSPSTPPTVTLPDPAVTDVADDTTDAVPATDVSTPAVVAPATTTAPAASTTANADQLLDIKQQALQQLTPLIGHLDQSPEEKFRTTMMMIQAADNHELIQAAYEAAQQIEDEKVRAQALLDIVNEINYFTHSNSQESPLAA
ncbi:MAG: hypothetical protein ABWX94_02535 [Candidatus Saccharimonadales bacterium]